MILSRTKIYSTILASIPLIAGCSGNTSPDSFQSTSLDSSTETVEEIERDAIATDCRTIGYAGVVTLTQDVLGVPGTAVLHDGQTLDAFLAASEGALGGTGIDASQDCTTLFHKTSSQLGLLACHWMLENDATRATELFPEGASSSVALLQTLTGNAGTTEDQAALEALQSQIADFDAAIWSSLEAKQKAAQCAAVYSALSVMTL